jgi:hypothetical protein
MTMTDHSDGLPAEVSDRMVRLLTAALTDAWCAALAAGATPDDLAEIVAERRRAVESGARRGPFLTPGV